MKLSRTALEVDGKPVPVAGVIALGLISGRVTEAFQRLRDAMSAEAALESVNLGPEGSDIQPVLNAWRNEHGLTSAESTSQWLSARDLELSDLVTFISRKLSLERAAERLEEARAKFPPSFPAAILGLADFLIFEDKLGELVQEAGMRAAAEPPEEPKRVDEARKKIAVELAEFGGIGAIEKLFSLSPEQAALVVEIEARFRVADAIACTPEALQKELSKNRRNLTRVELAEASFEDEGVALEVIATLRHERTWLEQLAETLGVEVKRRVQFIDTLNDSALAARLATGQVGDVVGPERRQERFAVFEVLGHIPPKMEDPEVQALLLARVRRRAFSAAIERHIRFHLVA
ncbi:MAG: hypothetical protein U1E65_01465 [Myxococcota bacterium]